MHVAVVSDVVLLCSNLHVLRVDLVTGWDTL